jgi:hypothetical protein
MLDLEEAKRHVMKYLAAASVRSGEPLQLMNPYTIAKPYGWVFFYNSARFVTTGHPLDAVAGNGPLVVMRDTGEIVALGSGRPEEVEIAEFERSRNLDSNG